MLTLLTILLSLAAISAYFYLYRHKNRDRILDSARDLSHLRPLFQPSDADLRADKRITAARLKAIEAEENEAAENRRKVEFQEKLGRWKKSPARHEILDLLNSVDNNGTLLADAAEGIYEEWNNDRLDLPGNDLAQLIESHFWLVPAEKRTPGVSYRIQRLLSSLRAGGGNNLQTHDSLR